MKQCKKCLFLLEETDFWFSSNAHGKYLRNVCKKCIKATRRVGDAREILPVVNGMKECGTCRLIKPINEFYYKNKKPTKHCKVCTRQKRREWWTATNQSGKQTYLRHGLTKEEFDDLRNKYDGKCWICKDKDGVYIDHDHNCCDKEVGCVRCVRGWLCVRCNTALGYIESYQSKMDEIVLYLSNTGV
jgi:hypothetical protein